MSLWATALHFDADDHHETCQRWVLQCVWPITDESYTRRELQREAMADLEPLATRADAIITGPPVWLIAPAERVPGWTAYAPGSVLIARCPATPAAARESDTGHRAHCPDCGFDRGGYVSEARARHALARHSCHRRTRKTTREAAA